MHISKGSKSEELGKKSNRRNSPKDDPNYSILFNKHNSA